MEIPDVSSPVGRLIDVWQGGDARDPAEVVAEHWMRAPERIRHGVRELTLPEARLWYYFGDRDWMKTEVFPQVPVWVPEREFGCVLGFFVPRAGVALEVDRIDPRACDEDEERIIDHLVRCQRRDRILEQWLRIATLHLFEEQVTADPKSCAEVVRWELGCAAALPATWVGINAPR